MIDIACRYCADRQLAHELLWACRARADVLEALLLAALTVIAYLL